MIPVIKAILLVFILGIILKAKKNSKAVTDRVIGITRLLSQIKLVT